MANCSSNGAQLPVILIVDMDNQVEEFIIFNPPSGPGSAINSAKLKEGRISQIIVCKNKVNKEKKRVPFEWQIYILPLNHVQQ